MKQQKGKRRWQDSLYRVISIILLAGILCGISLHSQVEGAENSSKDFVIEDGVLIRYLGNAEKVTISKK